MSRYVAAYDISDDRRRRRVARILCGFGERMQWSVFEVRADDDELAELRRELGAVLSREDTFDLIPIDTSAADRTYRWQRKQRRYGPVVLL